MGMASLNISLPQSLKDYLEAQAERGGYGTPSEYVRELLQQDQARRTEQRLEELLLEGLNSGDAMEVTPEYWERKRLQLLARHQQRPEAR